MNIVQAVVKRAFGEAFPVGATSFCTVRVGDKHIASFVIGRAGAFVDVEMTEDQERAMIDRGFTGPWGWSLQ